MVRKTKNPSNFFELSTFRRRLVLLVLLSLFATLISRSFYLQGMQTDFLQKKGRATSNRIEEMHAYRGKVIDRHGEILAISSPVQTIWVNPPEVEMNELQKKKLAKLLELRVEHLEQRLNKKDKQYVYLKRRASPELATRVLQLKIPGIRTEKNYDRFYPERETTAHLVGFTNIDGIGQEGVELYANNLLSGVPGYKKVLKDNLGRIVDDLQDIQIPIDGQDVQLSIDKRLQYTSYQALKKAVEKHGATSGSAVLLDAKTGEVLSMTNYPSYNPNNKSKPTSRIRNRVVTDIFEPGSTIKPITISAALESKQIKPQSIIDTEHGMYRLGGSRFTVKDTKDHGIISVSEVIQKSSNVGTTLICEKLDSKYLWSTINLFGLGVKTGVGFPGETSGKVHHFKHWRKTEHATISYGYGLSTNLLQLAQAYTVFANEGELKAAKLLKNSEPVIGRKVLSNQTSRQMLEILESVVSTDGTAPQAKVSGYRVAGKTGTAHKIINGAYENKYIGSFVGIAPVSNPRFVLAVMIDEPTIDGYYGGVVAGPVFSSIMSDALKIYSVPQDAIEKKDNTIVADSKNDKVI